MMTITQYILLAEPGLNAIWHEAETPVERQYTKLLNIGSMEKMTETDAKMAGFGALQQQDEAGSIIYDNALTPVTVDYTYVVRALGYKITDRLARDELYSQVELFERDLQRAAEDDQETFAFALLLNATATTIATGFDGLALASTAHTRLDGGATQANRPTSLGALSLANLHTGIIQFRKWVNDRGRPIRGRPKTLLVPPDLELTGIELLQSTDRPDTANRATNAVSRWGLDLTVSEYLTGTTTYWSLIGDKHDINFKWRFKPESGTEVDFDTDVAKRKVRQGMARGFGHWMGYYQGNT